MIKRPSESPSGDSPVVAMPSPGTTPVHNNLSLQVTEQSSDLPRATRIVGDGESQLLQLLVALSGAHQAWGGGHGGIDDSCLRCDSDGRLCLVLRPPAGEESPCCRAMKNENAARYYFNLGALPRPVDDLTALGVVVGELVLSAGALPDVQPEVTTYRKRLARVLRPRAWSRDAEARLRRLLCELLLAPEREHVDAVALLRSRPHLYAIDERGRFGRPSVAQRLRVGHRLRWLTMAAGLLIGGWWLGGGNALTDDAAPAASVASPGSAIVEGELEYLRAENESLRTRLESRTEIAQVRRPVGVPTSSVKQGELFERFGDLPAFLDATTRRLLAQETLDNKEVDQILDRLSQFATASRVWWSWIDSAADDRQIQAELAAAEPTAAEALRVWLAEVNRPIQYAIRVRSLEAPQKDEKGAFDLTINDTTLTFERDKIDEADPLLLNWRYDTPLQVHLERRWTYFLWDADVIKVPIRGSLAMLRLDGVKLENMDDGYTLRFSVEPAIGPSRVTQSRSRRNSSSEKRDSSGSQGDAIDPLKNLPFP